MKARTAWPFFAAAIVLTACVSARFFDTAPMNSQMNQTLSKANVVAKETENDYAEKSYLFKNIDPSVSGPTQNQFRDLYKNMTASIETARKARQQMLQSNAAFTAATKGKKQIFSKDKDWSATESSIHTFNTSTNEFNKAILNYSSASNTMAGLVTDKKLYFMASVKDVRNRLETAIKMGKKNLASIRSNIHSAEDLAIKNGRPMDDPAKQTLQAEQIAFSDSLKKLEGVAHSIKHTWADRKKISSVDPKWSEFQKLVTEAEISGKEMQDISSRLPSEIESMQLKSQHTSE